MLVTLSHEIFINEICSKSMKFFNRLTLKDLLLNLSASSTFRCISSTSLSFVTSVWTPKHCPPSAEIVWEISLSRSMRRAAMPTLTPCLANKIEMAFPNPLDAPVTIATFPLMLSIPIELTTLNTKHLNYI